MCVVCHVVRLYRAVDIVVIMFSELRIMSEIITWYDGDVLYAVCDICAYGVVMW